MTVPSTSKKDTDSIPLVNNYYWKSKEYLDFLANEKKNKKLEGYKPPVSKEGERE